MDEEAKFVGLKICAEQCSECLFTKNAPVSVAQRKQILADVKQKDSFFICHKATDRGDTVMCRGFYNANPNCGLLRITRAMSAALGKDFIKFVDPTVG